MGDINWDNHIQTAVETAMEYDPYKIELLNWLDALEDIPDRVVINITGAYVGETVDINIVNKWGWDDDEIH